MHARSFSSTSDLPKAWIDFFERHGASRSFYFSLPWFQNVENHALEPGAKLIIHGVEDGQEQPVVALVCRTPASCEDTAHEGLRPGRSSLSAVTGFQTTMFAVLTDDSSDENVLSAFRELVSSWKRGKSGMVSSFEVGLTLPGDRGTSLLADALREDGFATRVFHHNFMVYEKVEGQDFETYWKSRSSRLRNTLRRREKRLAKEGDIRFELIQDPADAERGIELYEKVFQDSWKEPEEFPDFVPGLIRASAEAGTLRLGILFLDERPVSAQLLLVSGGVSSILKLHYVESLKDYSPGTICLHRLMQHVIDVDGVGEVDFGGGTSTYKRWWMHRERKMITVIAFNPRCARGLVSLGLFTVRRARQQFREALAAHVVRPWREWKTRRGEKSQGSASPAKEGWADGQKLETAKG